MLKPVPEIYGPHEREPLKMYFLPESFTFERLNNGDVILNIRINEFDLAENAHLMEHLSKILFKKAKDYVKIEFNDREKHCRVCKRYIYSEDEYGRKHFICSYCAAKQDKRIKLSIAEIESESDDLELKESA